PKDRALGCFAIVALGIRDAEIFLADRDPRVRRAAAMASLARGGPETRTALLDQRAKEQDSVTRDVLGIGLLDGDAGGRMTTLALVDRAESGGPDAPLAPTSLARRADSNDAKVN